MGGQGREGEDTADAMGVVVAGVGMEVVGEGEIDWYSAAVLGKGSPTG